MYAPLVTYGGLTVFYLYALAYMSLSFALLVLIGVALHFFFEWCERDEATDRVINARHRA